MLHRLHALLRQAGLECAGGNGSDAGRLGRAEAQRRVGEAEAERLSM
jgi:hypothetical protein